MILTLIWENVSEIRVKIELRLSWRARSVTRTPWYCDDPAARKTYMMKNEITAGYAAEFYLWSDCDHQTLLLFWLLLQPNRQREWRSDTMYEFQIPARLIRIHETLTEHDEWVVSFCDACMFMKCCVGSVTKTAWLWHWVPVLLYNYISHSIHSFLQSC